MKHFLCFLIFFFLPISLFAQKAVSISGYVTDSVTGESLIGATVSYKGHFGITNSYGFYSIAVEADTLNLHFSYVGYQPVEMRLEVKADSLVNVSLALSETLSEAYVTATSNNGLRSSYTGALNIPVKQITSMPALLGEADVLKVLQKTPGVQTGIEGMSGMYVRGGGAEENLQLYDGVPMYNVNHLLGILSLYTTDAVKNVSFYKGSFPARYGGRVSSIVDVRTNDGNSEKLSGSVCVGLLSSKLHLEGPLFKNRTTFSLSARVTPTILFDKFLLKQTGYSYFFYDLNGKLSHRFSDSDRLTLSLYHGKDDYKSANTKTTQHSYYNSELQKDIVESQTDNNKLRYLWGNSMASLRWNHIFTTHLFSDLCVSCTNYKSGRDSANETKSELKELEQTKTLQTINTSQSGISDINADLSFEYNSIRNNLITFGAQATFHCFTPQSRYSAIESAGNFSDSNNFSYDNGFTDRLNGIEAGVFFEDDVLIGKRFDLNAGIRATLFNTQAKSYYVLEPRFSAQYQIIDDFSCKIGYSKMSQYVHLLTTGMMSLPTDLWVPITKDIKPVISDIVSAGLYYSFAKGWYVSLEGYWKALHNVLEYKDGKATLSASDWTEAVSSGEGNSKGVELFVEKKKGKTTGWVSYTLSKSTRWFPDGSINNGDVFPYTYDRRHNFNVSVFHKVSESCDLNASWTFYSGNMMTLSDRVAVVYDIYYRRDIPYVSSRNNYRLPSTHHLDISASFKKQKRNGERIWSVGIYNIYGRKNPNIIDQYVNYKSNEEGGFSSYLVVEKTTLLTLVPFVSYTFSF